FISSCSCIEFYSFSLHDALPISLFLGEFGAYENIGIDYTATLQNYMNFFCNKDTPVEKEEVFKSLHQIEALRSSASLLAHAMFRSEEHTSELQSRVDLVCRLLLE